VLGHDPVQAEAGVDRRRRRVHRPAGADAAQDLAQPLIAARRASRLADEPADQDRPDAADRVAADHAHPADPDQQVAERLAHRRGDRGRPLVPVGRAPQDRAEDPPSVERESRYQVEGAQDGVDRSQVRRHGARRAERPDAAGGAEQQADAGRRARRLRDQPEQAGQREAGQRPDRRDQELVARAADLAAEARDAAEDEQRDAADAQTARLGDQRVAELVGEHRGVQQQRRDRTEEQRQSEPLPRREETEVPASQPPGDEREGEQPRRVDAHFDAEEAPERKRCLTHGDAPAGARPSLLPARYDCRTASLEPYDIRPCRSPQCPALW
jgi:hypothetical protein